MSSYAATYDDVSSTHACYWHHVRHIIIVTVGTNYQLSTVAWSRLYIAVENILRVATYHTHLHHPAPPPPASSSKRNAVDINDQQLLLADEGSKQAADDMSHFTSYEAMSHNLLSMNLSLERMRQESTSQKHERDSLESTSISLQKRVQELEVLV